MKMRLISPGRLGFVRVAASLLVGLLSAASQRNGIRDTLMAIAFDTE
ncbi:MAG: hypothetical protein KME54_15850 [Tolypothrix brevis GSE-NOS-MK-07-07A]|jgi:hypothetical protein|nr:hypothetical protein [Tolypothrix brevis GSE-NOS-MK-07-07A]